MAAGRLHRSLRKAVQCNRWFLVVLTAVKPMEAKQWAKQASHICRPCIMIRQLVHMWCAPHLSCCHDPGTCQP